MEKRTMTINELCEYIGIARPTAYILAHTDGFPVIRIGKRIMIDKQKLDKWIDEGGVREINRDCYGKEA